MPNARNPKNDRELLARLEHLVNRDRRLPDGEVKRQVVIATLRRYKDKGITGSTLSDIASEEAERMIKRLSDK